MEAGEIWARKEGPNDLHNPFIFGSQIREKIMIYQPTSFAKNPSLHA